MYWLTCIMYIVSIWLYPPYYCVEGLDGVSFCKGLKYLRRKTNLDQQLLLCSLETICCLLHMLVTHVWYVSNPSISFRCVELMVLFLCLFFLKEIYITFRLLLVSFPKPIGQGKGIQQKGLLWFFFFYQIVVWLSVVEVAVSKNFYLYKVSGIGLN